MFMEDEERKKRYLRMFLAGGAMPDQKDLMKDAGASGNNPGVPALALRHKYSGMFGGGANSDVMSNVQPYNPDGGGNDPGFERFVEHNDPGFERQGPPHNDPGFERKSYPHNDPGFMRGGNDAPIGEPPPLYRPIPEGAGTRRSDMPMETGFGTPPPPEEPLGSPPPLPTATERTSSEIERLRNSRPREHSFGKRLGMGALAGLAEWSRAGGPGGLLGGLASVGTAATIFAASPGAEGEYRKAQKMQGLFGQLGQQQAVEAHQSQMQKPILDALENERERVAKSQLETQKFQQKLAEEKRKYDQNIQYLEKSQGSQYTRETNPDTGQVMLRNKLDSTKVIPATDPEGKPIYDPSEQLHEVPSPESGTMVKIKGKDLFSGESTIAAGNANRATNVAEGNRAAMQRYDDDLRQYNAQRSSIEGNIAALQSQYDGYVSQGGYVPKKTVKDGFGGETEVDDNEKVIERNNKMKTLEGQILAEKAKLKNLRPPQKPADVQTTNVGGTLKGKKVSLDAARKLAKSQGRNMTDEQLIQEIKSQGGVVY